MSSTELELWARSGAMWLTGRPDGPPLAAPGRPAGQLLTDIRRFRAATRDRTGSSPEVPGVELLGERAAYAGFERSGPRSCGGTFRTTATSDGTVGFNLARPHDLDVLPALAEDPAVRCWDDLRAWARTRATTEVVERARLLDMAVTGVPEQADPDRLPVAVSDGVATSPREVPRIVDLTSLWAGPLCAHLLAAGGAQVTKVESTSRPDGARVGTPDLFDVLHSRSDRLQLDFSDPADLAVLRDLISAADLVLESSRPRALAALGICAEDVVTAGTSWLSITARGRISNTIGFGDDVAVGAGLHVRDDGEVLPCGDALADPLAGVAAAAAASEALLRGRSALIDVSMHHVAAAAAAGTVEPHTTTRRGSGWWVESAAGAFTVRRPRRRAC